jgi:transposase
MELLHERCAALDIGKKDLKACVRTPNPAGKRSRRQEIRTYATTTNALLELRDWLVGERVSLVVMEATGDYWRAAFYLLEDALDVILVNAAHAKGLPGRKTDVCDAAWLCQLGECGLLRASFVPPEPIRQLRDLTRYRTTLSVERSREAQRLEKELEDAGIKLSSVATDILGVSGRAMLAALIDGERDPQVLAQLAKARMRSKIPQLVQALIGNFGEHHAFLCRLHLQRIDELAAAIGQLSARIEEQMRPFAAQLARLATIPGVGQSVAEVIVAETGADMGRFDTAAHLASWAGVCPGQHESAGKRRSGKTRHGNRWLLGALGTAAMAAARTKDATYLGARYQRLAHRLGKKKAIVAVEHSILIAAWHMLANDVDYADLGGDYFARLDPELAMRRIVRQANTLGFTVRFDPIQAA